MTQLSNHFKLVFATFFRTNAPVSRKTSDVRMPRIPSAQGTDVLSPGSRSNSVFAGRLQSREQELSGKSGD